MGPAFLSSQSSASSSETVISARSYLHGGRRPRFRSLSAADRAARVSPQPRTLSVILEVIDTTLHDMSPSAGARRSPPRRRHPHPQHGKITIASIKNDTPAAPTMRSRVFGPASTVRFTLTSESCLRRPLSMRIVYPALIGGSEDNKLKSTGTTPPAGCGWKIVDHPPERDWADCECNGERRSAPADDRLLICTSMKKA
jgi:hypothetical protein